MEVYYDANRVYPGSRLHPYAPGAPGQTGHVDLKAHPELIESALEDFVPFTHRPATQAFYELLRELNGPASHLESSDCAYRAPKPVVSRNSNDAIGESASRLLDDARWLVSRYTALQCSHRFSLFSCCSRYSPGGSTAI